MGRNTVRVGGTLMACLFLTFVAAPAGAQTRAEEIAERQAEKARWGAVEARSPRVGGAQSACSGRVQALSAP
jgi:hypothetical protein